MSATREKRKPVFDPTALADDLDDMWPTAPATAAAPAAAADPKPSVPLPPTSSEPTSTAPVAAPSSNVAAPAGAPRDRPEASTSVKAGQRPHLSPVTAAPRNVAKRTRPPEVLLSSEVYDELYRVQIAEKKVRRGLARTMGTIVLDAIEAHAPRLATTWSNQHFAVGEGQLFERPSSNAVPRRRRHASAPRTVVLSGVTAANGKRLDNLVQAWNAGTRSALVEQALRYEFGLLPGP